MSLLNELVDWLSPLPEAWAILLVKATVLLGLAWMIHHALARTNPRWRVLLWRTAAVALVALPLLGGVLPAIDLPIRRPELMAAAEPLPVESRAPEERALVLSYGGHVRASKSGNAESDTAEVPTVQESEPSAGAPGPAGLGGWALSAVWLGGVALLVTRLGVGYSRVRCLIKDSQPVDQQVIDQYRRVAEALGNRRATRIRRSGAIAMPLLCGVGRPVLLLPDWMCRPQAWPSPWPGCRMSGVGYAHCGGSYSLDRWIVGKWWPSRWPPCLV